MNDFRQVTALAIDCLNPRLAAHALERSMAQCDFGDALLLTDTPVPTQARVEAIGPIRSQREYSRFVLRQMAEHVRTPFVLIVQWDGFVLDARQWETEFLKWDYIGAPWPESTGLGVGNGGFSLRSRRLLDALADPVFQEADVDLEDQFICQTQGARLAQHHGVRFAPAPLAQRFSYELIPPPQATFGFHGLFNFWRHFEASQVLGFAGELAPRTYTGAPFMNLLVGYIDRGQYAMAQRLLLLALSRLEGEDLDAGLEAYRQAYTDPVAGDAFVATCRQLLALRTQRA